MANQITVQDIQQAIKDGKLDFEQLVSNLVGQQAYVRAGNGYKALVSDGVAIVGKLPANVYKLGDRVNAKGIKVEAKPRKAKTLKVTSTK